MRRSGVAARRQRCTRITITVITSTTPAVLSARPNAFATVSFADTSRRFSGQSSQSCVTCGSTNRYIGMTSSVST